MRSRKAWLGFSAALLLCCSSCGGGGGTTAASNAISLVPAPTVSGSAASSSCASLTQLVAVQSGVCPSASPSAGTTSSGGCSAPPATSPYTGKSLVWDDEFTYTGAPDPTKWNYDQLGQAQQNNEMEDYTNSRTNSSVANCLLTLTAVYAQGGYTSARLGSIQSWSYGRFDIMAKLPCGQGTWPALWMMPKNSAYGGWPNSGELDIMELSNTKANSTTILGTEHTAQSGGGGTDATTQVPTDCTAFHLYSMDWEQNQIEILVDNKVYNTYPSSQFGGTISFTDSSVWPFNKPFYFIFNIAVGGTLGGTPDSSAYPQTMQIQYVRVYQ